MPFPKSVKTAAIVSQSLVVLWGVLSLFSNIFQDNLIEWYVGSYVIEDTDKIVSWAVVVRCIVALVISGANILICSRKAVHTPLVMASVTTGIVPLIINGVQNRQVIMTAYSDGVDAVERLSVVMKIDSILSYFLSAAMIITIAAGAVYAYAKKNCPESEETTEAGEIYGTPDY